MAISGTANSAFSLPDEAPVVRSVSPSDLDDVLAKGWADFRSMPSHVIFVSLIYPILGLVLGRFALGYDIIPILYPLAAGFALIGPLAAIGLYELSRRREKGLDTSWKHAFDVFRSPSLPAIGAVGLLLLAIFICWLATANALYTMSFGDARPASFLGFFNQVLTTPEGHQLLILGNLAGFIFAVIALTVSVVSFPLLLDRKVHAVTAIATSARAVMRNPVTMALWGLIVAIGLFIGSLPLFTGLAIVLPVLGHATWHLYRKVIAPA